MYLDGPYGQPAIDLDGKRFKLFILIAGGIGNFFKNLSQPKYIKYK
jgi:hypothetical protein